MKLIKKILVIAAVVLFPLGIIYCVGKNLFNRDFVSFLGGIFLFAAGFVLAVYLLRYDIIEPIVTFLGGLLCK